MKRFGQNIHAVIRRSWRAIISLGCLIAAATTSCFAILMGSPLIAVIAFGVITIGVQVWTVGDEPLERCRQLPRQH
jgi:hypothetical protein